MASKAKYIKLTLTGRGDPTVGIWGDETTIRLERKFLDEKDNPENRKFIKDELINLCKEMFDDNRIDAFYEDECSNCGELKTKCKCREYEN